MPFFSLNFHHLKHFEFFEHLIGVFGLTYIGALPPNSGMGLVFEQITGFPDAKASSSMFGQFSVSEQKIFKIAD